MDPFSENLGPVVQSVLSLTSSLVVKILIVLVVQYLIHRYFCWENVSSFCNCKSYSHFFSKDISVYAIFYDQNFNDTFINDIVSFEQLGPDFSTALRFDAVTVSIIN